MHHLCLSRGSVLGAFTTFCRSQSCELEGSIKHMYEYTTAVPIRFAMHQIYIVVAIAPEGHAIATSYAYHVTPTLTCTLSPRLPQHLLSAYPVLPLVSVIYYDRWMSRAIPTARGSRSTTATCSSFSTSIPKTICSRLAPPAVARNTSRSGLITRRTWRQQVEGSKLGYNKAVFSCLLTSPKAYQRKLRRKVG